MSAPGSGSTLEAWRERLAYQPALLGGVALLAGATLGAAYGITKAPIAVAEIRDMQTTLAQVLPRGFADNDLLADVVEHDGPQGKVKVHLAKRAGRPVGAVFKMTARGYAGPITLLMAVDAKGRVLGVRVLKHTETPGLGDKIEAAKSRWIDGFTGKSLDAPAAVAWAVKKDGGAFDAFAGATVTPRAVVRAVRRGLEFFAAHRHMLGDES